MDFFKPDSELMQAISRAADLAWLNILCFICSIPVFTIGASISAKYYVAMKMERGQAPVVTTTFFRAFKANFLQDLKITSIMILICAFFGVDWYLIIRSNANSVPVIAVGMLAIFTAMFLVAGFCIFPMVSRFEMKTFDSFRNALIFGVVHLPRVFLGIFMAVIPFVIGIWYFKWAWLIWLFVACVALYYNSRFFIKSFDKLEERTFGKKVVEEEPEPDFVEFNLDVLDEKKSDGSDTASENETDSETETETEAEISDDVKSDEETSEENVDAGGGSEEAVKE